MLKSIAFETNRCKMQLFGLESTTPFSAKELEKFIGFYFCIGPEKIPN